MQRYMVFLILCAGGMSMVAIGSDNQKKEAPTFASVIAKAATLPEAVDYEVLMANCGYKPALVSKPAVIGALSACALARFTRSSLSATVALTGTGYAAGVIYAVNSNLYAVHEQMRSENAALRAKIKTIPQEIRQGMLSLWPSIRDQVMREVMNKK